MPGGGIAAAAGGDGVAGGVGSTAAAAGGATAAARRRRCGGGMAAAGGGGGRCMRGCGWHRSRRWSQQSAPRLPLVAAAVVRQQAAVGLRTAFLRHAFRDAILSRAPLSRARSQLQSLAATDAAP